jgi:hypothetical protein
MRIPLADSRASGFKKWSDAHPAISTADNPITAGDADLDLPRVTPAERPHFPWLVPGAATPL